MKKTVNLTFLPLLVVALLCAGAPAWARNDGNYTVDTKIALREAELANADANRDRKTTLSELLAASSARFAKIDANRDGFLDNAELSPYVASYRAGHAEVFGQSLENQMRRMTGLYRQMDKDRDARVSRDEYDRFFGQRYGLFDRDGDGAISATEYRMDVERTPYITR